MQLPPSVSQFNYTEALARMADDTEIYNAVAEVYLSSIVQLVKDMHRGIDENDHELVLRSAHSSKSSSRIVGADIVGYWSEELEEHAREQKSETYAQLLQKIEDAIKDVLPEIEKICRG